MSEISGLDVTDLDLEQGMALVRRGKGAKDRVVPVRRLACDLARSYLTGIRAELLAVRGPVTEAALLLSRYGARLGPRGIAKLIARHAAAAGIDERIPRHTFRHSCATHMLRGGASIATSRRSPATASAPAPRSTPV